ncbi:2-amino-4-hydroxy-6-hydroxymethyldihydropteridine diphosphokinase [Alteromonas sp. a30]|uniref:2-amino-4-hydroxy-6- hydroxymethyldihydropteridine diphosphokinase n=1 Tax=Alteromonas sp. a30 TaxID=2730917 RepID=UPI002280E9EB|nr:2-amino-4-hydroxy-6-hydroxymethyldihydropteridine diphosphokinase [Alteromonas sp. a30]MCY7296062.1 2-amino-4-hydroxy-6-hydroxymethyldihydropteridine diphosphokinase [Alteromonas sp. a30]
MNHIYISLGTNIEREKHTKAGLDALFEAFGELELSPVYESESVGFDGNPFYNLVVGAKTEKSLVEVCHLLKKIEKENGRISSEKKFSPRTLDLDLLLFNDEVIKIPIILPRPEILYNAFVLLPLQDLTPHKSHPEVKKSYSELWKCFDKDSQKLWKIPFIWNGQD